MSAELFCFVLLILHLGFQKFALKRFLWICSWKYFYALEILLKTSIKCKLGYPSFSPKLIILFYEIQNNYRSPSRAMLLGGKTKLIVFKLLIIPLPYSYHFIENGFFSYFFKIQLTSSVLVCIVDKISCKHNFLFAILTYC